MAEQAVQKILDKYPPGEGSLIEILHDVQQHYRYLPRPVVDEVADHCAVPVSKVVSVATFYQAFSFDKKGENVLRICTGTACHVKGASLIRDEAERLLGVRPGETTPDGKYSLEEVNCVGACAMAPLVIKNEKYHGKFKPIEVKDLLEPGEAE